MLCSEGHEVLSMDAFVRNACCIILCTRFRGRSVSDAETPEPCLYMSRSTIPPRLLPLSIYILEHHLPIAHSHPRNLPSLQLQPHRLIYLALSPGDATITHNLPIRNLNILKPPIPLTSVLQMLPTSQNLRLPSPKNLPRALLALHLRERTARNAQRQTPIPHQFPCKRDHSRRMAAEQDPSVSSLFLLRGRGGREPPLHLGDESPQESATPIVDVVHSLAFAGRVVDGGPGGGVDLGEVLLEGGGRGGAGV